MVEVRIVRRQTASRYLKDLAGNGGLAEVEFGGRKFREPAFVPPPETRIPRCRFLCRSQESAVHC